MPLHDTIYVMCHGEEGKMPYMQVCGYQATVQREIIEGSNFCRKAILKILRSNLAVLDRQLVRQHICAKYLLRGSWLQVWKCQVG